MKTIQLTQNKFTIIDDIDFEKVSAFKWQFGSKGYASRLKRNGRGIRNRIFLSRFIMDCPSGMFVDHINGDTLNNTRENLRICTPSENRRNSRKLKGAYSIYKGVSKQELASRKKPWISRIYKNGIRITLGRFESEIKAAQAYNLKAKELFGEFALLNKI